MAIIKLFWATHLLFMMNYQLVAKKRIFLLWSKISKVLKVWNVELKLQQILLKLEKWSYFCLISLPCIHNHHIQKHSHNWLDEEMKIWSSHMMVLTVLTALVASTALEKTRLIRNDQPNDISKWSCQITSNIFTKMIDHSPLAKLNFYNLLQCRQQTYLGLDRSSIMMGGAARVLKTI